MDLKDKIKLVYFLCEDYDITLNSEVVVFSFFVENTFIIKYGPVMDKVQFIGFLKGLQETSIF